MTVEPLSSSLLQLAEAIRTSPHNLVSRRARGELTDRHLPECRAFAHVLPPDRRVLDLGSGGGLPGLVIALERPDLAVELLEATGKKVTFLRETAQSLGVQVAVHQGRAEDLGRSTLAGRFEVVTARALAPLDRLAGWAAPFLTPGGCLYAIKGARWQEELDAAGPTLRAHGLEVVGTPEDHPQLRPDPDSPHRPLVVMLAHRS